MRASLLLLLLVWGLAPYRGLAQAAAPSELAPLKSLRTLETLKHLDTLKTLTSLESSTSLESLKARPLRPVTSVRLFGIGAANVLDTYLSPLEYTGSTLSFDLLTQRLARWGKGRWGVTARYTFDVAYLHSPTDDGKAWHGNLAAAGGLLRHFRPAPRLRLSAGATAGGALGFTYLVRNGNNPAQGRLAAELSATLQGEYAFLLFHREAGALLRLDAPVLGAMFTPAFGQSYYEIFSVGESDHNVRLTHPFNAPSARLLALVTLPVLGAHLSVGYSADVRQSHVNHLKRHDWQNRFVIGYTRRFVLLR